MARPVLMLSQFLSTATRLVVTVSADPPVRVWVTERAGKGVAGEGAAAVTHQNGATVASCTGTCLPVGSSSMLYCSFCIPTALIPDLLYVPLQVIEDEEEATEEQLAAAAQR